MLTYILLKVFFTGHGRQERDRSVCLATLLEKRSHCHKRTGCGHAHIGGHCKGKFFDAMEKRIVFNYIQRANVLRDSRISPRIGGSWISSTRGAFAKSAVIEVWILIVDTGHKVGHVAPVVGSCYGTRMRIKNDRAPAIDRATPGMDSLIPFTTSGSLVDCVDRTSQSIPGFQIKTKQPIRHVAPAK
jgi:hypothetical protein